MSIFLQFGRKSVTKTVIIKLKKMPFNSDRAFNLGQNGFERIKKKNYFFRNFD